ncbi:la ribonucleoprotein translational regulator Achilles [Cochliomyia hominivorax]
MSESTTHSLPQPEEVIPVTNEQDSPNSSSCTEVRSHGHTFLVSTVHSETVTTTTTTTKPLTAETLTAIPVTSQHSQPQQQQQQQLQEEKPCCSSSTCSSPDITSPTKAVVPLSSSLPSKLLRFHAKKSAQALLQRLESQEHSLDSQCDSDEGMTVGYSGCSSNNGDYISQDSYESLDHLNEPSAPPMSPPPPRNSPSTDNTDERIDVGMGSSIEGSEESEEDDELKPLAVDNHVLPELAANSSPNSPSSSTATISLVKEEKPSTPPTAVLSEANLEKFRKHQSGSQVPHPIMDNIYLHPNFKYDFTPKDLAQESSKKPEDSNTSSPVTAEKRVHRSFLTMKKSDPVPEKANSVVSQSTTASGDKTLINEIDSLDPALIPSEDLAAEISEAVEFYFSNDSILKDAFLLKHVKRNKEGFVSLKLVSSFKRVRQLTKDWKVVGNAVRRKSRKIELNDVGTKVRRIEPLPNFDETMPSRTIVACDLPLDKLTIEKVSDIFSKCGEIALIRILKPGMAIPVDVRQFMNKYPEMQQKECALVEYLESSSAREARNLQGPFKVYEMVAPKKKTGKKAIIQVAAPVVRMVENYRYYNDHSYERTRGGSFSGMPAQDIDLRYRLKRNNSDFASKIYNTDIHHAYAPPTAAVPHHYHHNPNTYTPQHRGSFGSDHHQQQQQPSQQQPYQPQHHSPQHHHHYHHQSSTHYQPRGSINQDMSCQTPSSPGTQSNFFAYNPRRYSNTSTMSANTANNNSINNIEATSNMSSKPTQSNLSNVTNTTGGGNTHSLIRRLSNCSQEGYADAVRRSSNCSDSAPQRRDSNCSENCPCSRRISDFAQTEVYRKTSQGSIGSNGERRFSNGSIQFERSFSNASDTSNSFHRRPSNDYQLERKQSLETQTGSPYDDPNVGGGGGGYNVFPRRYSNNFNNNNNISSKLAAYDNAQYINGRRISTDSGYDRRFSFGSEYEGSPRSRTNSFLNNYKHSLNDYDGQPRSRTGSFLDGSPRSRSGSFAQRAAAEHLVRTPIGPDGSKGFGTRARKLEQTIAPV